MSFQNLFDLIEMPDRQSKWSEWTAEAPPSLAGLDEVVIDFETTGLKWWDGDKPCGLAYYTPDGRSGYLPWAHQGDPANLDENRIKEWWQHEVKGKRVIAAGAKTEIHAAHSWDNDCDLEELGCSVTDVQHHAALLDDTRRKFSLETLCQSFLPDERKVHDVGGDRIEGSRMSEYPAGMIAVRAIADARQTWKLKEVFWPQLDQQDLQRVRKLEDDCNFATCEMERNAQPIDTSLLDAWCAASKKKLDTYIWTISNDLGIKNFSPSSAKSWERLLEKTAPQSLYEIERTSDGKVTTQYEVLNDIAVEYQNEYLHLGCQAMKLADLRSDFLVKYRNTIGNDGLLRFALHQLRADEGGTITGRFASSAIRFNKEVYGANIQQVPDIRKSIDKGHDPDFLIRKLFIGGEEGDFLSADAAQIEFRILVMYAKVRELIEAYAEDPDMSFHRFVYAMVLPFMPSLSYEHLKNINFMKIYGGGLAKLAVMMNHITMRQANQLKREYHPKSPPRNHPLLARAAEVDDIYARHLPFVREVSKKMEDAAVSRGYVCDMLGRRTRDYKSRPYKALNGVIQGGAGSVLKHKMVIAHRTRKQTGFIPRLTVHDELAGTAKFGQETKRLLLEKLNDQESYAEHGFPKFVVPIRWEAKVGANWAEC